MCRTVLVSILVAGAAIAQETKTPLACEESLSILRVRYESLQKQVERLTVEILQMRAMQLRSDLSTVAQPYEQQYNALVKAALDGKDLSEGCRITPDLSEFVCPAADTDTPSDRSPPDDPQSP